MQKVKIPRMLDPVKSAQKKLSYDGILTSSALSRLSEAAVLVNDQADALIHCDFDKQGLVTLTGSVKANVEVECQRCNSPMPLSIDIELSYALARSEEQAEELPSYYDAMYRDEDGETDIWQIIEDELLLSLPIVPMHDPEVCSVKTENLSWGEIDEGEEEVSPFDVLKQLKKD